MIAKRLDILGFKSFVDRTEVSFVPGVTAVVGPNGSGKSNIVDALRWVLGEQSAKTLRGAKMEDIIFAGTERRRAVNFCEVSLTLDNASGELPLDYAEVTISRRAYRSGESEYLINKRPCRLKDIAELFMDTGVGREAYSIIGQGRIEEILSTKSEDRRGVFEEAAGIVKFKLRRREAEKKLADAGQNLTRIRDIVAELSEQLEPLRERAETAKAYKEEWEQVQSLQISVLAAEIDLLGERRSDLYNTSRGLLRESEDLTTRMEISEQALMTVRTAADDADAALQGVQAKLLDATAAVEKCEADRRVAFERQEHGLRAREDLRQLLERLLADKDELEREDTEARAKVERLRLESSRLRDEWLRRMEKDASAKELAALREQVAARRTEIIDSMRRQAAGRNEVRHLAAGRDQEERLAARSVADADETQKVLAGLAQEEAAARREAAEIEREIDRLTARAVELSRGVAAAEKAYAEAALEERDVERIAVSRRAQLDALRELARDGEGFANGPRAVLQGMAKGRVRGVRGAVADLLRADAGLELAVETALGAALQFIAVDTEKDARAVIEYLRKGQHGRATFLPLETIRGRRIPPHDLQMVRSAAGFVGVAVDKVQFDPAYKSIADSLLGNVLIAQDLVHANALARVLQHRFRIVTREGDAVNSGGSMTGGGSGRRGPSLLGRTAEIDRLGLEVEELTGRLTILGGATRGAEGELTRRRAEADECRTAQIEATNARRVALDRLHAIERAKADADSRLSAAREARLGREAEAERLEQRLLAAESDLTAADSDVARLEGEIAVLEARIEQKEQETAGRTDFLTELRVELAEAEEALRGAEESLNRMDARKRALDAERDRTAADAKRATERLASVRAELLERESAGRLAQQVRDDLAREAEVLRGERIERARRCDEAEAALETLRAAAQILEQKRHAAEVAWSRADVELDNKVAMMREEFHLGVELARERYPLSESLSVARPRLADLRRRLDGYGDVSLSAIEEYDRLSVRFSYLEEQERDLSAAKGQIAELIEEIDQEMAARFTITFERVREQFQSVFRELFDGGKADVFLTDPERPLASGIEIVAQPPGKKLQVLTLLSGGERALTALALLFAILRIKPVPFCVLDEVEAALDEANVGRFAQYLRSYSEETQFVIITHRRGTMEIADVLYGVTMQEGGVSKLVSVKVQEDGAASA